MDSFDLGNLTESPVQAFFVELSGIVVTVSTAGRTPHGPVASFTAFSSLNSSLIESCTGKPAQMSQENGPTWNWNRSLEVIDLSVTFDLLNSHV